MAAQLLVLISPKDPLKIPRRTCTRISDNGPHFGSTTVFMEWNKKLGNLAVNPVCVVKNTARLLPWVEHATLAQIFGLTVAEFLQRT
jgi:hypothetical protein